MTPTKIIDPILNAWAANFQANQASGIFTAEHTRPYNFIINNNKYKGKPFFLVGAGPSLDKNIDNLKEYQKTSIIMCADVVLPVLLDHGIIPDFVVTIDPSDVLALHISACDTSQITYICPTTVSPKVLQNWRGKVLFFNQAERKESHKYRTLKKIEMPGWTSLMNNYFVGATMYQIANTLGAYVVGFVGYDLALTHERIYCAGVLERRIPNLYGYAVDSAEYIEKVNTMYKQVYDEQVYYQDKGTKIYTTQTYSNYKYALYTLLSRTTVPAINCTEGGGLFELTALSVKEFGTKFCIDPIMKSNEFTILKRKKHRR